jgi:hypothetical protein
MVGVDVDVGFGPPYYDLKVELRRITENKFHYGKK